MSSSVQRGRDALAGSGGCRGGLRGELKAGLARLLQKWETGRALVGTIVTTGRQ